MSLLLNSAGGSAGDPILKNLGFDLVLSCPSMDLATLTNEWIDAAAGFPGTNTIGASLSPAAAVVTAGNAGSYDDTTKRYTISSTTGLSVGDYIYLSHASLTAGVYKIASIVSGTTLTLAANPLDGAGNKSGIAYQVAWRYAGVFGTAPVTSSSGGSQNFAKGQGADSLSNASQLSDSFFVRDAPAGSAFIAIGGGSYTGQTISNPTPTFALLAAWAARGGVSHVELANHSGQGVNNFKWGDGTITEKTLAAALASGFSFSAGDGVKYGAIKLKSVSGAAVTYNIDMSLTLDTTGPTLVFALYGR